MHPALSPIRDVISGTADLEYVNRRLVASGFCDLKIDTVAAKKGQLVCPTTPSPSPQSSGIFTFGQQNISKTSGSNLPERSQSVSATPVKSSDPVGMELEALHQISPDSEVRCDSRDCPIKNINHNLGRYFHDGEQAPKDLESSDLKRPNGFTMEPIRHFFNFTVPSPGIVAAYINMCESKASQADKDMVRQYQKHHMWEPTFTGPSTPRPCRPNSEVQVVYAHVLPFEKSGILDGGGFNDTRVNAASDVAKFDHNCSWSEVGLSSIATHVRPLCAADFEDTDVDDESDVDDEDWVSENVDIYGFPPELSDYRNLETSEDQGNELEGPLNPKIKREIPRGSELAAVQRWLQEKILGQIGRQAL